MKEAALGEVCSVGPSLECPSVILSVRSAFLIRSFANRPFSLYAVLNIAAEARFSFDCLHVGSSRGPKCTHSLG